MTAVNFQEALQKFIKEANLDYKPTDEAFLEYLADFGAMEWDKVKRFSSPNSRIWYIAFW